MGLHARPALVQPLHHLREHRPPLGDDGHLEAEAIHGVLDKLSCAGGRLRPRSHRPSAGITFTLILRVASLHWHHLVILSLLPVQCHTDANSQWSE